MAVNGSGKRLARERRAENFGKKTSCLAFVQAMRHADVKPSRVAIWLGVSTNTIKSWLALKTSVATALVLDEPRLAEEYASCLSVSAKKRARAEKGRR